jgi:ribonuclease R
MNKKRKQKKQSKPRSIRHIQPLHISGVVNRTRHGYGFVSSEDGGKDIYVSGRDMNGAMHGDTVDVTVLPDLRRGDRQKGRVDGILKRAVTETVGTFELEKHFGYVVPDDKRLRDEIFIPKKNTGGAQRGDKVLVRITKYPDINESVEGIVTEIISKAGDASGDVRALVRGFGIREDFPDAVKAEAIQVQTSVKKTDISQRRDLRGETVFTIDGADSKDFDDAVSVKKLGNGNFLLGVHIADVSYYVTEDSPLDKEALHRGTSIYLPELVIPMLPEALSNGICSLNEKTDRLTLSVDMEITPEGTVTAHEIYESVICSVARLVYDDISDILEHDDEKQKTRYADILRDLNLMQELADILHKAREKRGSIDFDLDEAFITLGEDGIPAEIGVRERRTANRIIEAFMLLANETVAKHCSFANMPFVYRVHEPPDGEKMQAFAEFISEFGIKFNGNYEHVKPATLGRILKKVQGTPAESIISTVLLRSMKKASYDTVCLGHFGLALRYYCHFTSPIRRYPDLIIHRMIKESLHGKLNARRKIQLKAKTEYAAKQSSETEANAAELEREVEKLKKTEYMAQHIGETYEAQISGITSFGIFAQLENTVEGLIPTRALNDDYYEYEPGKYRLKGRLSGKTYNLGDQVKVTVSGVNKEDREINFTIE